MSKLILRDVLILSDDKWAVEFANTQVKQAKKGEAIMKNTRYAGWREGELIAVGVLEFGRQKGLIAETQMPTQGELMMRWFALTDEKRALLLKFKHPNREVMEIALELAGSSWNEARARRLEDTPEARRAARLKTGI